jgi:chloramphenicol 3-O-phosphotransferase
MMVVLCIKAAAPIYRRYAHESRMALTTLLDGGCDVDEVKTRFRTMVVCFGSVA